MDGVPDPEIGRWYRVISGVHRGKEGVVDLIKTEGAGTRYRLNHPHQHEYIGRFAAEQLAEINAPKYVSQLSPEVQAEALRLVTTGRRDA
jgi:Fe2+ or Zn2+ uptake regulation protein